MVKKDTKNTQNDKKANIKNKVKKTTSPLKLTRSGSNEFKTRVKNNKNKKSSSLVKPLKSKKATPVVSKVNSENLKKAVIPSTVDKKNINKKLGTGSAIHNQNQVYNKMTDQKTIVQKDEYVSKKKKGFKIGDSAVYPSHGVGKVLDLETLTIGSQKVTSLVMFFEREKLTIRIPLEQVEKTNLRHLATKSEMDEVFSILRSGIKKLKGMWSRRAQEYESKINSGNIILLAEVLRDLTRDIEDVERSYSERIIYETAIYRLALEYSVITNISFEEAKEKIISIAKNKFGESSSVGESKSKPKDDFDDEFDSEEEPEEDGDEDDEDYEEDE